MISIPRDGDLECFLVTDIAGRKNASFLRERFPLNLVIVPTLSPLEQNEELVLKETVERNRYGRLASRNFRNFWLHKSKEEFDRFAELVELGWPGIKLSFPEVEHGGPRPIVRMYFRDGGNVREVQWAGFGFQVWMQTMMHLSGADKNSTLILDEPDIYLHPDLQHRLLDVIGQRVGQYFVATHSTEIINAVEPGDVLIVRPDSRGARRIQGESGYSDVYAAIGSSENAQFARLAKTKKVLYFEGKDARILSKVAKKQGGMDFISTGTVTLMKTDGFANWSRVSTSSWVFENFFGFHIPVAAIFDRDYRCDDEVEEFLREVNTKDTRCEVLPPSEHLIHWRRQDHGSADSADRRWKTMPIERAPHSFQCWLVIHEAVLILAAQVRHSRFDADRKLGMHGIAAIVLLPVDLLEDTDTFCKARALVLDGDRDVLNHGDMAVIFKDGNIRRDGPDLRPQGDIVPYGIFELGRVDGDADHLMIGLEMDQTVRHKG
ncbi:ATP-dependent endonuclease [Agrobacterium fabrum]|uniref:ATP-dependent nuclease n=1 Tax=Agrobacterium fabrum TaxID=1176649 RepID=UPI001FCF1E68|nr:AAA family ATPase [Agrobacterium fabrum]